MEGKRNILLSEGKHVGEIGSKRQIRKQMK